MSKENNNCCNCADYGQEINETGWVKLPNGLIIQWGEGHIEAHKTITLEFPIRFSKSCVYVDVTPLNIATAVTRSISEIKPESVKLYCGSIGIDYKWMAMGY